MSSVNWKKCKRGTGDAVAMLRHAHTEERLKHEHANEDIDKTLTAQNRDFTFEKTETGYTVKKISFSGATEKMKHRLTELAETNKRKDAVETISLTATVPAGIPKEKELDWCKRACLEIYKQAGSENFISASVHFDEVHTYLDHGEEKISRPHIHVLVIPEVNGNLNAKQFSSRKNMIAMNNAIEKMSVAKFGCNFMTGEKKKGRTVEELKAASYKEATEKLETAKKELDSVNSELEKQQGALRDANRAVFEAKKQLGDISTKYNEITSNLAEMSSGEEYKKSVIKRTKENKILKTPATVTIPEATFNGLCSTAWWMKKTEEKLKSLKNENDRISKEKSKYYYESLDLRDEIDALKNENSFLKQVIKRIEGTSEKVKKFVTGIKQQLKGEQTQQKQTESQIYETQHHSGPHM